MAATTFQFLGGGILLLLVMAWKGYELRHGIAMIWPNCPKLLVWSRFILQVCISLSAVALIIDPLVSGTAALEVRAPQRFPTTMDNLSIRAIPHGFLGLAGGNRITTTGFDDTGTAHVYADLQFLETRVILQVIDQTRPAPLVANRDVYVSPWARHQLSTVHVTF